MTSGIGRHVALLLAAGGSRRLGQPKQLLLRDGEPLVRRAARLLSETAPLRLLVVAGAHHADVVAALADIDCEVVVNPDWADGLASSLRIAADALHGIDAPVLVSTCDQPALETQHLLVLLQGASCAPSRCAALLHEDGPGVPAVVPADWLLQQAGEMHGDRGLGQRFRVLPQGALHLLDARDAAFDVDTDADRVFAVGRGWLDS